MTELSLLYKDLGFYNALTYIQSGNVIFKTNDDSTATDTALRIERAILDIFNYNVPVMIRKVDEIRNLLSVNPFIKEGNSEPSKMAVIFLYEKADEEQIQKVVNIDYPPDKFKIIDREIFIYCPNGFGRTKLYTNFFEKKMGVLGTARNWKTVTTILNIAEKH